MRQIIPTDRARHDALEVFKYHYQILSFAYWFHYDCKFI